MKRLLPWLPPLVGLAAILVAGPFLLPWQRLAASTLGMLLLFKASILLHSRNSERNGFSRTGLFLFLTVWPGMDPEPFRARLHKPGSMAELLVEGSTRLYLGLALTLAVIFFWPHLDGLGSGWLGCLAILTLIHFGYSEILTGLMRGAGWQVNRLFDRPLRSRSLADFWSRRWNLAFVEMDRRLFLRPLRARLGKAGAVLGIFALSGLLHELAISYPAGKGWGMPLAYFLLQGGLILLEPALGVNRWKPAWVGSLWTWFWILAPIPLLFHAAFRHELIQPLFAWAHGFFTLPAEQYFSWALRFAALGHFLVLIASFQVPSRLNWKEDLGKLTRFNRNIMWTYAGFVLLCIVSFGTLLFALHGPLLEGGPAAVGLLLFNGVFWGLRVGIDLWLYRSEDWPAGVALQVGHVLINGLFMCLAAIPSGLAAWHLLR